jgi:hypothetical protein
VCATGLEQSRLVLGVPNKHREETRDARNNDEFTGEVMFVSEPYELVESKVRKDC